MTPIFRSLTEEGYIAIAKIKQDLTWTHTLDSNRANPFLVRFLALFSSGVWVKFRYKNKIKQLNQSKNSVVIAVFNWMYQYFGSVSVGSVGGVGSVRRIFIEIVSLLI
ncbi:MAG: hypothetical protein AB4062_02470 [Crocosphaera sp.]